VKDYTIIIPTETRASYSERKRIVQLYHKIKGIKVRIVKAGCRYSALAEHLKTSENVLAVYNNNPVYHLEDSPLLLNGMIATIQGIVDLHKRVVFILTIEGSDRFQFISKEGVEQLAPSEYE